MNGWNRGHTLAACAALLVTACEPKTDDGPGDDGPATCADGLPVRTWDAEGPYGLRRGELAEDVTLPGLGGAEIRLSELWGGCDVVVFVPDVDASTQQFQTSLFARDHAALFERSPENVHWVFFSWRGDASSATTEMRRAMNFAKEEVGAETAAKLEGRLHYVDGNITEVGGWIGEKFARTSYGFLVDRDQRIRDIGSLADPDRYSQSVGWFGPNVSMAANEAVYANFVAHREADLTARADEVTEVVLLDEEAHNLVFDIELPDATTMAGFDGMTIDLVQDCIGEDPEREFGTCPEWDYLAHLYVCGLPDAYPNPRADEACQQRVPGVPEVEEVLGTCTVDGVATEDTCRTVDDCMTGDTGGEVDTDPPTVTCDGYVPPVEGVEEIPADTGECSCTQPDGSTYDGVQTCNAEGTGFGECDCPCEELARWITTYHREGRYVHEADWGLSLLQRGGTTRFRYNGGNRYDVDLKLLFRERTSAAAEATYVPLFTGGRFDPAYNDKYAPLQVEIPADATKVELVATISGHGFGNDDANCAEFCNHEHHFTVGDSTYVKDHPEANQPLGCVEDVANGTVPNQFGTWFYGRGGWCPGKQVVPVVWDVTGDVTPGQAATISYEGRFGGMSGGLPQGGGFAARIDLESYLVIWR